MLKARRRKKCRVCGEWFLPRNTIQATCFSPECVLEYSRKLIEKREKRRLRHDKERIKTRGQLLKEAQVAFNRVIRLRDADLGCVSCDRPSAWQGQWHASHYRSVGAHPEFRFDEMNAHKACSICNNHLSGALSEYRKQLLQRIGEADVLRLEGRTELPKWTREQIIEIKKKLQSKSQRTRKTAWRQSVTALLSTRVNNCVRNTISDCGVTARWNSRESVRGGDATYYPMGTSAFRLKITHLETVMDVLLSIALLLTRRVMESSICAKNATWLRSPGLHATSTILTKCERTTRQIIFVSPVLDATLNAISCAAVCFSLCEAKPRTAGNGWQIRVCSFPKARSEDVRPEDSATTMPYSPNALRTRVLRLQKSAPLNSTMERESRFRGRNSRTVQQEYRERLIMRIGLADMEYLEGPHEAKHYSVDDLREIKAEYQRKKRELKKCRN